MIAREVCIEYSLALFVESSVTYFHKVAKYYISHLQEITLSIKLLTILSFASHAGLKALALLGVLPDADSTPENQAPPVTVPTQTSEEQLEKKALQSAQEPSDAGAFVPCSVSGNPSLRRESHSHGGAEQRG